MKILIEGGRVIDPANQVDAVRDVLIEDGRIAAVQSPGAGPQPAADRVLDARGKVVCPGFVANTGMFARKQRKAPGTLGVSAPEDVARAVLMAIQARKPELIVNPRPVRPLMVLKALSPGMAVNVARRLGLIKFLRSLASK